MSDADILREARIRYQEALDGDRENRSLDEFCRRFYRGRKEDQWEASDLKRRKNRISVVVNRTQQFAKQITGEMRQNKPAIKVLPVDDKTDPKMAETYSAIIRHIESQSGAHRIYAKAGEQAVIGGIGWFRILTDYRDGMSFDQEIYIKAIRNPLSVVIDPGALELSRKDMRYAFVSELMTEERFKREYKGAKTAGFESSDETMGNWRTDNSVRVAEYWKREAVQRDLVMLTDGSVMWGEDITEQLAAEMGAKGIGVQATRKSERYKVKCKKISGVEVLESYDWEGSYIPLIPVIGEEIEVGDDIFRHGIVYPMIDSQRGYNFARSAMLEAVSSQPKAPFMVTAKMVAQHKEAWESLNEGNPPVLMFDADPAVAGGAPIRQAPPNFASAWYQEAIIADGDMKATTGIYDASLGKQSNETSGKAIMARDQQGETASFVYVDNEAAAIEHCGRCLIELIPKIYTAERTIRIMGEDGTLEGHARINTMLPDGQIENDISVGQYDLEVTIGPAFATKRMEAADKMMALVQSVPAIGQIGADMIVKALDMPYGDKLADRLAIALVPPGMDADIDKKRMEMQAQMGPPQPDPAAELQLADLQAEVDNKVADTALTWAKVESEQVSAFSEAQRAALEPIQQGFEAGRKGDGP